jgi:hypothetical protein
MRERQNMTEVRWRTQRFRSAIRPSYLVKRTWFSAVVLGQATDVDRRRYHHLVRHRRQLAMVAAVAVGAVAGCGGGGDASGPEPDASAYAAALAPSMPVADPEEHPNVFVAPFEETLALEEQVAIIEILGEDFDVKFVDDAASAVDTDAVGRPVRDDGLLIVLGTLPAEPPYVVRVEEYRREDDVSARLVTLVWRTDRWVVASEQPVRPEAVIGDG